MNKEILKFGNGLNMQSLDLHVRLLESLNYKVDSITGYGEGVFTVSVKMLHDIYPAIFIRIPPSSEDGSQGHVEVRGHSRLMGDGYTF